jgi:hypothetical protein
MLGACSNWSTGLSCYAPSPRGLGPSGFHPLREAQSTVHFSDNFLRVSAKGDQSDPESFIHPVKLGLLQLPHALFGELPFFAPGFECFQRYSLVTHLGHSLVTHRNSPFQR